MTDITARLDSWLTGDDKFADDETLRDARDEIVRLRALDKFADDSTLRDARDEIVRLRALLERQNESSRLAVRMATDYAERYGYVRGGLDAIAAGHTTAAAVVAGVREKYGDQ